MKRTALLLMLLTFLAVVPVPTVAATTTPSNGRIVFSRFDPEADDSRLGVNAEPIASRASHRNGGGGPDGRRRGTVRPSIAFPPWTPGPPRADRMARLARERVTDSDYASLHPGCFGERRDRERRASPVGHVASDTRPAGETPHRCPVVSLATAMVSWFSLATHRAAASALDRLRYELEP
jgi:hypothetical protein